MATVFDAIVAPSGGDYTLPSAAFANGAVNVYMKQGVYYETGNVVLPEGAKLTGALRGSTIIDFGANAYSLVADSGYGTAESKGTVAVTHASPNVVGTSTTFTNLAGGDWISIGNNTFEIASVIDDSNLVLANDYNGMTATGLAFKGLTMLSYVGLSNFTVRNSTATGVLLIGCRRPTIEHLAVEKCSPNVAWVDCAEGFLRYIWSQFSATVGAMVDNCESCTFNSMFLLNNVSHGLAFADDCANLLFHDVESASNGGSGFYVDSATFEKCTMTNCVGKHNNSHGMWMNANGLVFTCSSSTFDTNAGCGLQSQGARGVFEGNVFHNNGDAGLDISGDDCISGKNTGYRNVDGIRIGGARNVVIGSSFTHSDTDCCHVTTTASDTIIVGCHFNDAGANTLNDQGTNTVVSATMP